MLQPDAGRVLLQSHGDILDIQASALQLAIVTPLQDDDLARAILIQLKDCLMKNEVCGMVLPDEFDLQILNSHLGWSDVCIKLFLAVLS